MATETPSLLHQMLEECVNRAASDLHLSPGDFACFRLDGELVRETQWERVSDEQTLQIAAQITGRDPQQLPEKGSVDGALSGPKGSRFRYNVFRRQGKFAVALRRLEERIRSLQELGLPSTLYELADLNDGLVVVAGPTGSGKSTTLATLIDRVNQQKPAHIITIEDPIEYLHPSQVSLVNQRQIGLDSDTFQDALVSSLRQDPDVILVGEVRELDTIRTAITAAETGHLVFTTVHAGDCVGVIERLISVFPADEQTGMRRQLALVLRAVIAQHLIVCDGPATAANERRNRAAIKRTVASEILRVNSGIANLIATGKSNQIYSAMEAGTNGGMQTFDQDLARLLHQGYISEATAFAYAHNPTIVQDRVARLRQRPSQVNRAGGNR